MSHPNMRILRGKLLLINPKHRRTLITKLKKKQIKITEEKNELKETFAREINKTCSELATTTKMTLSCYSKHKLNTLEKKKMT